MSLDKKVPTSFTMDGDVISPRTMLNLGKSQPVRVEPLKKCTASQTPSPRTIEFATKSLPKKKDK